MKYTSRILCVFLLCLSSACVWNSQPQTIAASPKAPPEPSRNPAPAIPPPPESKPVIPESPPGPYARDAEGIRVAMRSRAAGVAACYSEFTSRRPGTEGTLAIHVVIDPKGEVMMAGAGKAAAEEAPPPPNSLPPKPPIVDAPLTACIVKEVRALKFVEDTKGKETRVDYPFQLTAKRVSEGRI